MACECCRPDVPRYDMVSSHICSPSSGQMGTSGYQVQSSCCHHAQPSHIPVFHHQHISSPSHCHSWHPVPNEGQGCCHVPGSLSHHHEPHRPVFASPLHISHSHTTHTGIQQLQCDGGINDPACHSPQFLTPQPQHSQPFYQSRRQLLAPPFLPTCHAGVTTPTHPHRKLLPQSPLSSYARPLPASPEHQGHCQLEFSSPLGEDDMVLSTKLVPSRFLLAHPTGPSPDLRPMEHQHLHSPNATSQVQMLVGSPRVPSMHQAQSQDLPAVGQLNQNAFISTLQQTQRQKKSHLPALETALRHPPMVVVQKLPVSMLPKREASQTQSATEDPWAYPERERTRTGIGEEEESMGDLKKHHRRRKEQASCKQVSEHCAEQFGDVEAILEVPVENKAILKDALHTQPIGTKVPPASGTVLDGMQKQSRTESNTKVVPRRSSRLRYLTDTDDSQSEQEDRYMQSTAVSPVKMRSVSDTGVQKQSRTESNTKIVPRRSSRLHYLTDTDDSQSEQDDDDRYMQSTAVSPVKMRSVSDTGVQKQNRTGSNTKIVPRRSSRLRYLIDTDDSQSEQDVLSTAVRPVKMKQKKGRVKEHAQPTVSVEVEEDASVESKSKIALRRSSRLHYFTDTDDSQSEQDVGDKLSAAVRQKKGQVSHKQVDEHCVQQIGDVEVEEPVPDVPAEEEAILEDAILTQPTSTKVPPSGKDSGKTGKGTVVLSNWYFKVAVVSDSSCMVLLQGTKSDDTMGMLWHSGPVVKWLSPRELATKSGTVYCLRGPLDQTALAEVGINDAEIAQSFKNGFPENWLELIEKQALEGKKVVDRMEDDTASPAGGKPTLGDGRVKVKSEPKRPKTPDFDLSVENSHLVSSLKRSSRGRTIKPSVFNMSPYINLTSEVYSYDWYGSFQGISSPVIDLTLCDELPPPKAAKRQIKKEKHNRENSQLTKKERQLQKQEPQPCDLGDDSPLVTAERDDKAAARKTTVSTYYSTDSCSGSALPSERKQKRGRIRRCIPLSLTKKRVKKVLTKTQTTRTYDEGQTGEEEEEEEEAVVRVEVKTRKSVRCAQKCNVKGRERSLKSQMDLLPSSESESELDEVKSMQKHKNRREKMLPTSRTCSLPSSESESESDGVKPVRSAPKCRDKGGKMSLKSQTHLPPSAESESELDRAELTKPSQLELRGVDKASRRGRTARQPTNRMKQSKANTSRPSPQDSSNQQTRKNTRGADRRKVAHKLSPPPPSAPQSGPQYSEWTLGDGEGEDEEGGDNGIPWGATDIKDLKSIVHAIPAMTSNFWERVARRLGTGHSARECSHQYLQLTAKPLRKKHPQDKPTDVTTSGPIAITGRVGTMKRKRQIRDALEQIDRDYTDDIFESTPFKKKVKRVQLQELSDESFNEEDGVESQPIQTPSEAKRRLGAPSSFTPKLCSYLTTPDLKGGMKRETADNVMYKIQKAKKGRMPKQPTKTGAPPGKTKPLLFEQRLRNIRTGETTTLRMFEDSDDSASDSNPFSDIEENYQDIIRRLH